MRFNWAASPEHANPAIRLAKDFNESDGRTMPQIPLLISLCNLCVLCVSVVSSAANYLTTETQRVISLGDGQRSGFLWLGGEGL